MKTNKTRMIRAAVLIPLLLASTPLLAEPDYAAAIRADYDASLGSLFEHFHRNPELSFREFKTAARMAKELRAIPGIVVTEKVGQTGVVGVMKNGAGPVVLVRADMDGLPVLETSGLSYASTARQVGVDGKDSPVMHACGHDTHITAMLATAKRLAAMKNRWFGTVLFVVQPAEEALAGAKAMLEDGLYTRFPKPDYALSLHVSASLPTGQVSASEGVQYSSADSVNITVFGVATHGASPHKGKDPVYIASQIVVALQGIISREKSPLKAGVITVGAFNAGNRPNIITDRAELQLTLRANDEETRAQLIAAVRRVADGIARANGVPEALLPKVEVIGGTPTTINNAALAKRINAAFVRNLGASAVTAYEQSGMGAEDFAYLVASDMQIPGFYFAVGGTPAAAFEAEKNGGAAVSGHHSGLFKVEPKSAIVTGATAMTVAVLELLGK